MPKKFAKVKAKKVTSGGSGVNNPEIIDMFNQMVGTSNVDINICYPQYDKMRENLRKVRTACEAVLGAGLFSEKSDAEAIRKIVGIIDEDITRYGSMEFEQKELLEWEKSLTEETLEKFTKSFKGLKSSDSVHSMIGTANNLHPYKKQLSKKKIVPHIAQNAAGLSPFAWADGVNIKYVTLDMDDHAKATMATFLQKIYTLAMGIYQESRKPTIDVDKFSGLIRDMLKSAKKHPELHRLEKAFKALEGSMDLFKDNFGEYYRDFVQTKNPGCIMQNFITDVSQNGKYDFQTLAQLKKVVQHFQKVSQQQGIKDPKIKTMLDEVNKNFQKLDANMSNLKK